MKGDLRAYRFVSEDRDGNRETRVFYAESLRQATDYARRWGRRTRHRMYRVKRRRGI